MEELNLWGEPITIPTEKVAKEKTKKTIDKIQKPKTVSQQVKPKTSKLSIMEKIKLITAEVIRVLGVYKSKTIVIKSKEEFIQYIDACIQNNEVAIDTETNNSLDPLTCKLMGLCLYTQGQKNAYIPVNHVDENGSRLDWQITEEEINEQLNRLPVNCIRVAHNGKFDYQVLKQTCNLDITWSWDTLIAEKLLDENKFSYNLKQLYIEQIDPSIEKYSIEELFENVPYEYFDPEVFALYAATDAYMTLRLKYKQEERFKLMEGSKLFKLFTDVEMPIVKISADMELTGVELDKEYAKRLSEKYHNKLNEIDSLINKELEGYKETIDSWKQTPEANAKQTRTTKDGVKEGKSKNEQLSDPISISSPTQLAILLYDILKVPVVEPSQPRGTGEEILLKLNLPICQLILTQRAINKLLGTYVDALPEQISVYDNRLHANFNQLGAATGRFSSNSPNLQNIPSHNKEIRMMFKAKDGYTLVGSDFSQQEPRLLAEYSKDTDMINAYKQGKDLYATIAAGVYHNRYEDNLEASGPEGKERRSSCKSLLLGIMYGRGIASIAEQIHGTYDDAKKIVDDFYSSFPKVKQWIDKTTEDAKKNGYVEDFWGRRRRLPDLFLPKYTIKDLNQKDMFNPLLNITRHVDLDTSLVKHYSEQLDNIKGRKEYSKIKEDALKHNIQITDNGGFISQAERQCVNARIQGGAATMTKKAMIQISKDEELKDLGFTLLLAVHDELIGECPEENKDKVAERLCYVMKTCVSDDLEIPFKCDADIAKCWYYNDYSAEVQKTYKSLLKIKSEEEARKEIYAEHTELDSTQLEEILATI